MRLSPRTGDILLTVGALMLAAVMVAMLYFGWRP